jgi:hypothetical protein
VPQPLWPEDFSPDCLAWLLEPFGRFSHFLPQLSGWADAALDPSSDSASLAANSSKNDGFDIIQLEKYTPKLLDLTCAEIKISAMGMCKTSWNVKAL